MRRPVATFAAFLVLLVSAVGCEVPGSPVGALESVAQVPGGLRISGWAIDPDMPGDSALVRIYLNGKAQLDIAADRYRPGPRHRCRGGRQLPRLRDPPRVDEGRPPRRVRLRGERGGGRADDAVRMLHRHGGICRSPRRRGTDDPQWERAHLRGVGSRSRRDHLHLGRDDHQRSLRHDDHGEPVASRTRTLLPRSGRPARVHAQRSRRWRTRGADVLLLRSRRGRLHPQAADGMSNPTGRAGRRRGVPGCSSASRRRSPSWCSPPVPRASLSAVTPIAAPPRRSLSVARTVGRRRMPSGRRPPTAARRRRPARVARSTNAAWPSTSVAPARASAPVPARASYGWPPTPRRTGSTTFPPNPGTGRSTATDGRQTCGSLFVPRVTGERMTALGG